jgi:hypothetical protein
MEHSRPKHVPRPRRVHHARGRKRRIVPHRMRRRPENKPARSVTQDGRTTEPIYPVPNPRHIALHISPLPGPIGRALPKRTFEDRIVGPNVVHQIDVQSGSMGEPNHFPCLGSHIRLRRKPIRVAKRQSIQRNPRMRIGKTSAKHGAFAIRSQIDITHRGDGIARNAQPVLGNSLGIEQTTQLLPFQAASRRVTAQHQRVPPTSERIRRIGCFPTQHHIFRIDFHVSSRLRERGNPSETVDAYRTKYEHQSAGMIPNSSLLLNLRKLRQSPTSKIVALRCRHFRSVGLRKNTLSRNVSFRNVILSQCNQQRGHKF